MRDFSEIDYGFELDGRRHQRQLCAPIVLDRSGRWATLLIVVWRDIGIRGDACTTSRLEWHLSKWSARAGVWRRTSNFVMRSHVLEGLCGLWWTGELTRWIDQEHDYAALGGVRGVIRQVRQIPWWMLQEAQLDMGDNELYADSAEDDQDYGQPAR